VSVSSVYGRCAVLASESLLLRFPEVDYLVAMGGARHSDLREGFVEWEWAAVV
jgi:hypothetical protein